ncbi:MAG: response regulator [Chloroflexi bacterium]|nr:response regulator [Chloroflexota bacterium]
MSEQTDLSRIIRDAVANLYDYAALETHPLGDVFPKPRSHTGSQAEYLRQVLTEGIETLKPPERLGPPTTPEHRPYLVLHGRYVEGVRLQELQNRLGLSERQLRRENGRALRALTALLWEKAYPQQVDEELRERIPASSPSGWMENFRKYHVTREALDLPDLISGVVRTIQPRIEAEAATITMLLPSNMPAVESDRIILRQILLGLLSFILDVRCSGNVDLDASVLSGDIEVHISFLAGPSMRRETPALSAVRYWIDRLDATLEIDQTDNGTLGEVRLTLSLPRADQPIVMVIDDQATAIRMFRRFLSQSDYRIVGVEKAEQALYLARDVQPEVITLDVMMPTMDGWEVLQALQMDPDTKDIPVIICSVWDEPELAGSLGAAGLLRKPVTQKDLIHALSLVVVTDKQVPRG